MDWIKFIGNRNALSQEFRINVKNGQNTINQSQYFEFKSFGAKFI